MATVRDLDATDAQALTALYEDYPWWEDRSVADVEAALANTEVALGVTVESERASASDRIDEDGSELVAAARVLSDYRFYATVYDLIVATNRRGEGHGKTLMDAVVEHPDLKSLPGISLLCRDGLVPFYESIGFELYDREMEVPEGGTEELVRMTYDHEG